MKLTGDELRAIQQAQAVAYAGEGKWNESEKLLAKMAMSLADEGKSPSGLSETYRLLGEVRAQQGNFAGAADAYRSSIKAVSATTGGPSLEQLQGLVGSLVLDGRGEEAVTEVAKAIGTPGVGQVEGRLLLGKAFAQWPGHVDDALAAYDQLIVAFPKDFRGFLAKGTLLQELGRKGDATRCFIQARFLAPPEARALIDRYASR